MQIPQNMQLLRHEVQQEYRGDLFYQIPLVPLFDTIRGIWPIPNFGALGMSSMAIGYHLVLVPECERACVHQFGRQLLMLGDRSLGFQELEDQING